MIYAKSLIIFLYASQWYMQYTYSVSWKYIYRVLKYHCPAVKWVELQ